MNIRIRSLVNLALGLFLCMSGALYAGTTERVSVDSAGTQGNGNSIAPMISADGRSVAFSSRSNNLVAGDTNGTIDVFVHDRDTGTTERVSVDSAGNEAAGGDSSSPAISFNGRFVAFVSNASNLVTGDTNGTFDVFIHDRDTGTTERVSVDSSGNQVGGFNVDPAISADGRFVAFASNGSTLVAGDTNGAFDIFVHDRDSGETTRVSVDTVGTQGNGHSFQPGISSDGRFVAFSSTANNLVAGDTNGTFDVFVHDRDNGTTERISVDSAGVQGNGFSFNRTQAISADDRFVTFHSSASNLVAGDTNGRDDVFVHDRTTGTTSRVSVDSAGAEGNNHSSSPAISADGRFVSYQSFASNLVAGDTSIFVDIFVHDRNTGNTERVSVNSAGVQGNGSSFQPTISSDDRFVAFRSFASNLVAGDTNGRDDVFVHDRGPTNQSPIADAGMDQSVECASVTDTAVTLDGSGSSDSDGDPLSYDWSWDTSNASGVGPTISLPLGSTTISLVVNDGQEDSAPDEVLVTVSVAVGGFQSPLAALAPSGGIPESPDKAFKKGRVLPLKLILSCQGTVLTGSDVTAPEIIVLTRQGEPPLDLEVLDLDAGESADSGFQFRDSGDGQWIYNLKTSDLAEGTYEITIEMPDGQQYDGTFVLK
ncbi:hypothetical protein [Marinobacterium aestuariivivens]|uniref:PKD/Chitinase domain-containing protein n=1 Tax=Marinobacterium aestuariivivens TaxID=1698799 RepID=A0ABW2AAF1_9GAMM